MDRNLGTMQIVIIVVESLSARRAWIEITLCLLFRPVVGVALRKESVDRNILRDRRHWQMGVALRKESVDRNCRDRLATSDLADGRSPQGERG